MNTIFDRLIGFKRVLSFAALVCAVIFGVVLMDPLSVHAEGSQFSYVINTVEYKTRYGTPIRITMQYTIESPVPLVFLKVGDTNVKVNFDLEYGSRPAYRLASLSGTPVQATVRTSELLSGNIPDSSYTTSETWLYTQLPGSSYFNCAEFSCNIPRFSNEEALNHYLDTNDYSGADNIDEVDPHYKDRYSGTKHNFLSDSYDSDIPVPQLSNFSHNGFIVDNASDDLYLDLIVESWLSGVTIKQNMTSNALFIKKYDIMVDSDWIYSNHYFNFSDLSDVAYNNSVINISDLYGIDNSEFLVEDFKKWSLKYPTPQHLPTYKSGMRLDQSFERTYSLYHVYNHESLKSEYEQLLYSGQAFTSFTVRFYDENMNCSKWVKYTYNQQQDTDPNEVPGQQGQKITVSSIDNIDGLIVETPNIIGVQDANGKVVYRPYSQGSNPFFTYDVDNLDPSSLLSVLTNLTASLGSVPSIFAVVFSFLPSWLIAMIAVGIGSLVLLRLLGR